MAEPKSSTPKTLLTISVGFTVMYLVYSLEWAIWLSVVIGGIGILSPKISRYIEQIWLKIGWLLSLIVPNILLSIIFYIFLTPIALLSRILRNEDKLLLKKPKDSTFKEVNEVFAKESFEKPW